MEGIFMSKVKELTLDEFKNNIFDFEKNDQWKYEGTPVIIDFYASYCGPCKSLAPILDEVAQEMGDKVQIFKVNIEKEEEFASSFDIRSIPTLLFIPSKERPIMEVGAPSKVKLQNRIKEILKI